MVDIWHDTINNWDVGFTLKIVPKWMKVFSPLEEEESIWIRNPTPQKVDIDPTDEWGSARLDRTKIGIRGLVQTIQWHENILVQSARSGILPMSFHLDDPQFAKIGVTPEEEKGFVDTIQEYLTSIGIKWEDNQHIDNVGTPLADDNTYWHYFDISSEDMRTWYKYWKMEHLMDQRQGGV
ncbi:MAG TPA: hypothetical protein EYF95_07575 [Flavobacteriales bacterium]|jgi:hypothetical protein|nr:hypothetical protein [Flavobacteriales bacterium]